ncbi:Serine/threonine protein phosphatase family protein [hydrothermal vent metagenome]|uniref:Serine/threonine protein phosphatase family protein n=1 Tax=hydrothermal vent metagenome TaxID=652676 RepID=A0A3B0RTW9_9ZZZZ
MKIALDKTCPPRLTPPMTEPLYILPDIHGQTAMLDAALALIHAEGGTDARIIFLGDYVDRGPDSRGVIDRLMTGQAQGKNWLPLRGNHDQMFLDYLDHNSITAARLTKPGYTWLHQRLGGMDTLASYGVTATAETPNHAAALKAVPVEHRNWLANLPYYHLTDDLLILHAGIAPGVPLSQQSPEDMLWLRGDFLENPAPHPWLVIHGHTALDMPTHFGNRIDLDGGAGWGRHLWPAVFEGRTCWLLSDKGRLPLSPP